MKHFLKLMIIIASLAFAFQTQAYDMPIGIPDPGFGLDEAKPNRPNHWNSEIAGYYYVEDTAGCSNSQTYGHEGSPRCYLPNPIPAGSYVEVHGTYNHTVAGTIQVHGNGTVNNPIWVVGENSNTRPTFTDQVLIFGSYIYIDNVKSYVTSSNDTCFKFGTSSHSGYKVDHCMVRNSEMMSNSDKRASGAGVAGYDENEAAEYIIIANNHMHNFGILFPQPDHDVDAHVVTVNKESRHVWILENIIHDAGGAGIAIGQEGPNWHQTDNQWIYAGRNHVYNTLQANMAIKGAWHVVFSENNVHDPVTRWANGILNGTVASPSKCFGWKGEPQDYWIINNTCQNASYGIHGGATVDHKQFKIYILNNTFKHIHPNNDSDGYTGTGSWGEAAISMIRGGYVYAIGNSIEDSSTAISCAGPGGASASLYNYYIENNIIRNTGHAHMVFCSRDNPSGTHIRNNIIYQPDGSQELIRWGSRSYTGDLAGWQTASGEGGNVVISDPKYFSPDNNDMHLQSGSPAIGAGLADTELSSNVYATFQSTYGLDIRKDRDLVIRPQGTWDIGAFEYNPAYSPEVPSTFDGNQSECEGHHYIYCEQNNKCGTMMCCGYNPDYCNDKIDCEEHGWEYTNGGCVASTTIRADVDNNSTINTTDAMLTLRNSLGLNMSNTNWFSSTTTGDVNCDNISNSTDAMLILRHSLGLDMSGTGWCE